MAISTEKWINKGLWVLCRSDEDYPHRLKKHLKRLAPPILYGAGDRSLLGRGGLAVVGSRHINEDAESFARTLGQRAAQAGMPLVSGAARGVDETAMQGALEEGGTAVGVMADGLLRAAVSGKYRNWIRNRRLVLISPYHPESRFTVGNAMGRNKYIYALAEYATVVNSDFEKGGTWAGAMEELKRERGCPVFVRTGSGVPKGNIELMNRGAIPFPSNAFSENLRDALHAATVPASIKSVPEEQPAAQENIGHGYTESFARIESNPMAVGDLSGAFPASIYEAVKPHILAALDQPRKLEELASILEVRRVQLQDWLKVLMEEGMVEYRTIGKTRKVVARKPEEELKLRH